MTRRLVTSSARIAYGFSYIMVFAHLLIFSNAYGEPIFAAAGSTKNQNQASANNPELIRSNNATILKQSSAPLLNPSVNDLISESETPSANSKHIAAINNIDYIDALIDPNIEEESIDDFIIKRSPRALDIYQVLEFRAQTNVDNFGDSRTLFGFGYTAAKQTSNYGALTLRVTTNQGEQDFNVDGSNDFDGIGYYQLEQKGLPITESLTMNNTLGTHSINFDSRYTQNLIARRFNAFDPDILGLTSQVFFRRANFNLSYGKLGFSRGSVLESFEVDDGTLARIGMQYDLGLNLLSLDYWETSDFDGDGRLDIDANKGQRVTLDSVHGKNWRSSISYLGSEGANAYSIGLEQERLPFSQDFGAYYYEPDFVWINRAVEDDTTGFYYRLNNRNYLLSYGFSGEFRRTGLDGDEITASDTVFSTANLAYRLDRAKRLRLSYRFRNVNDRFISNSDNSSTQHQISSTLGLQHSPQSRSTFGLSFRTIDGDTPNNNEESIRASYGFNREINSLNRIDASFDIEREDNDGTGENTNYSADFGWNKSFYSGNTLNARIGYSKNDNSRSSDSEGVFASLNYGGLIGNNLSFDFSANYNRTDIDLNSELLGSTGLLTDDENEFITRNSDSYSFALTMKYTLDGGGGNTILGQRRGQVGSGQLRGLVFIDKNQDGIRQSNEKGLANVVVFLDGSYPTKTDSSGRFSFTRVGVGEHYIFVDETELPLPWSLDGNEYIPVEVRLRKTQTIEIPVYDIGSGFTEAELAEADSKEAPSQEAGGEE